MPANHSPHWYREKFKELAGELHEARRQERRPNHLMIRATRASVQAARLVIEGVNAAVFEKRLDLRDHLRFAWTGKFSGSKGAIGRDDRAQLQFHLIPNASEDDGAPFAVETASKDQFGRLWVFPIFTVLKSVAPSSFKPDAGAYDWRTTKKDDQGRLLGRDGKPLTYVAEKLIDPDTGDEVTRWELSAEPAYIGDDYDTADWLAHHRTRVCDWADACSALADLVRESAPSHDLRPPKKSRRRTPAGQAQPDPSTGYVARPSDPTAYLPITVIRAKHCEGIGLTTIKEITKVLEDYLKNQVRWTRPWNEHTGQPHPQRRNVHLVDWRKHVDRQKGQPRPTDERGFPDQSPEQIEAAKVEVRKDRQRGR